MLVLCLGLCQQEVTGHPVPSSSTNQPVSQHFPQPPLPLGALAQTKPLLNRRPWGVLFPRETGWRERSDTSQSPPAGTPVSTGPRHRRPLWQCGGPPVLGPGCQVTWNMPVGSLGPLPHNRKSVFGL